MEDMDEEGVELEEGSEVSGVKTKEWELSGGLTSGEVT